MTNVVTGRTLSFRALGYRFDVVGEDAPLMQRVADCYQDLAVTGDEGEAARYVVAPGHLDGEVRLLCDGTEVCDGAPSYVLGMLLWHVNQQTTQRPAPGHVVLHAAAATRNGRAVVLAAPMESGKTTTVAGLVQDGWGYLTDEAAAVSLDDLHVEAFHKSLSVDTGSWGVLSQLRELDVGDLPTQWQVPVSTATAGGLAERTPVGWVVLPRYLAGARTELEPVSRATAVMSLAACTFCFIDQPQRNLDALARIVRAVDCYRLTVGSLDEAVAILGGMADTS